MLRDWGKELVCHPHIARKIKKLKNFYEPRTVVQILYSKVIKLCFEIPLKRPRKYIPIVPYVMSYGTRVVTLREGFFLETF